MGVTTRAREAALGRLADLVAEIRRPHVVRVGIDGVDAAGKTTLADELHPLVEHRGRPGLRASIDGFHCPRRERHRRGPTSPDGYYRDSFDYEALRRELLEPLGPGGSRLYRTRVFDHRADEAIRDSRRTVPEDAVLLFDGVFLLRPELDDLCDFRVRSLSERGEAFPSTIGGT
jgi:uridine kinase